MVKITITKKSIAQREIELNEGQLILIIDRNFDRNNYLTLGVFRDYEQGFHIPKKVWSHPLLSLKPAYRLRPVDSLNQAELTTAHYGRHGFFKISTVSIRDIHIGKERVLQALEELSGYSGYVDNVRKIEAQ